MYFGSRNSYLIELKWYCQWLLRYGGGEKVCEHLPSIGRVTPYCVLWSSGSLQTKIHFVRQQLDQSTSTLFLHVKKDVN